jgi:hypothetical protein
MALGLRSPLGAQETPAVPRQEAVDFFEKRIRPVLHEHCLACHGPEKQKGGLRLDSRSALLSGGDSGTAVVPGDPERSLLLRAIRQSDAELVMPPRKAGKKLPSNVLEDVARWIREGAVYPPSGGPAAARHWAFEPVARPAVPAGGRTPIDAFLKTDQEPADPRTLLRRVTYDLTGLPPSAHDVDAFVRDCSPDAYEKVVDRLLASPAYGEKWGRKWLDVVRYADTAGENSDHPAPHAWRYRNWVIDAFNRDLPYDQFLREQVAGDLLAEGAPPERYAPLVVATGYLAVARRFGHDTDQDMHLTYEDVIDTIGKSVLGLTLGCARCHNHKYDPVTTRDYYALYGIFASTRFSFPGCEPKPLPRDLVPLLPPQVLRERLQPWGDELARRDEEIGRFEREPADAEVQAALAYLRRERTDWVAKKPAVDVAYAVSEGQASDARFQNRGEPQQPGDPVPRRNLELLGGQAIADPRTSGRLDLAHWLTDPRNPLTARVMVNRLWQGHFGRGIVATPNDFGARGALPENAPLLDYLASQFQDRGWSLKSMHRMILRSDAYRRSRLGGFPARRLEAEEIRDTLLALSGELDSTPGGPHPFPPESAWTYTQHRPFKAVYDSTKRSVYLMTQRLQRHPFLALFDGPDTNASTSRRETSTVPTQALYFLNDPFFHARARAIAVRLLPTPEPERAAGAHRLCFQRDPTAGELRRADAFLRAYRAELGTLPAAERDLTAWSAYLRTLLASNEFLCVD